MDDTTTKPETPKIPEVLVMDVKQYAAYVRRMEDLDETLDSYGKTVGMGPITHKLKVTQPRKKEGGEDTGYWPSASEMVEILMVLNYTRMAQWRPAFKAAREGVTKEQLRSRKTIVSVPYCGTRRMRDVAEAMREAVETVHVHLQTDECKRALAPFKDSDAKGHFIMDDGSGSGRKEPVRKNPLYGQLDRVLRRAWNEADEIVDWLDDFTHNRWKQVDEMGLTVVGPLANKALAWQSPTPEVPSLAALYGMQGGFRVRAQNERIMVAAGRERIWTQDEMCLDGTIWIDEKKGTFGPHYEGWYLIGLSIVNERDLSGQGAY